MTRAIAARPFHVAAACIAGGLASSTASPTVALGAVVLAGLAAFLVTRTGAVVGIAFAMSATGVAVGDARLHALDAPLARVRDAHATGLRVQLLSPARPNPYGSSAEVRVAGGALSGVRLLMRVQRWTRWPSRTPVGGELLVTGRLRPVPAGSGAGFDLAAQLRRAGIGGELFADHAKATGRRRGGMAGLLDAMRRRAQGAVAAGLPRREAALARGMVLGQDEQIDETSRQDWRDSGLAHLLAVSGQNVMLLVALAMPLLALARLGPLARGLALLALVGVYVPLAGAGPSLQRAGVMGAAGIAAMTLSRPASRWYALLLAAAATLALNPRASADPGWQLSFAAVAGILILGRPLAGFLDHVAGELTPRRPGAVTKALVRGISDAVAITFAASLATAPLVAFHFGAVPVAGLVANLLALPAVAPAMWLGMVKAALGIAAPVLPPADTLAELLGPMTRVPLAYLEGLAERCAYLPGGRLALPLRSPLAVCLAYLLIGISALAVGWAVRWGLRFPSRGFPERAAAWRRAPRSFRTAVLALVLVAVGALAATGLGSPSSPSQLTVRFLDIGQGDATLVQDGHGASVLFDAGPPEGGVYRELRKAGVRRIDLAVSTHQSRDHQGGFHELINRMPIGVLLENAYGTRDPDYRRLLAEADAGGIRRVAARAGETFRVGRLAIELLGPPPRPPGAPPPDDPNPIGVAAIVSEGDFDLWLSADAESDAILRYPLRPVDAMKVSHHGSADPGLAEMLDRLEPKVAALEVGAHNTYGHPTPSTLAALARAHVPTYRTDEDGTVTLTVTDGHMRVTTEH